MRFRNFLSGLGFCLITTFFFCSSSVSAFGADTPGQFRIQSQWNIGGDGGWGYPVLDSTRHRLYIPRTDRVVVIDTESGAEVAQMKGLVDARCIALDREGKYGYVTDITDGTAGFVRVFDLSTSALVASLPTGKNPDSVVFEPVTSTVFAFNFHGHSATVIDTSQHVAATVTLPGNPTSAVADGKGALFISVRSSNQILRLDASSKRIAGSWSTDHCIGPSELTLDYANQRVLAVCENNEMISLNPETGKVSKVSELGIGTGNIALDAKSGLLFCADSNGALMILHQDSADAYSLRQQVNTMPGARMIAVDPANERTYLLTSKFGPRTGNVSEELQFRPTPVPNSFLVIVVGR